MSEVNELECALLDVISKATLDQPEKFDSKYMSTEFMGNTISDHLNVIAYLGKVKLTSDIDISDIAKTYGFKPFPAMAVALVYLSNPAEDLIEKSIKADIGANDSQFEQGRYLETLYKFYTEIWKTVCDSVEKHEENMEAIIAQKKAYQEGKRSAFEYKFKINGKVRKLVPEDHPELSKNNEWVGMIHKCGYVGYTYKGRKCCNECIGRFVSGEFMGPQAPFDSFSTRSLYKISNWNKFHCDDNVVLRGIYFRQTQLFPEYTPNSTKLPQE